MARPTASFLFLLLVLVAAYASAASSTGLAGGASLDWMPPLSGCKGTVAECLGGGEEFELSSEVSRRILATTRYISYNALRRDSIPCSRRGASYYNCRPGAQANPYSRGCSAITRCRS